MTAKRKIRAKYNVVKITATIIMFLSLFFLTGVNFLVYPQQYNKVTSSSHSLPGKSSDDPSAPVEEKSSSNSSVNIQEEYLHERHGFGAFECKEDYLNHLMPDAEKLQIVHFELVSPPPKV